MTVINTIKLSPHKTAETTLNLGQEASMEGEKPNLKRIGNWIMVACCVPMVIGAGILLWAMGPDATWSNRISTLAPLALCFGAHLIMHKLIGHSCHKAKKSTKDEI